MLLSTLRKLDLPKADDLSRPMSYQLTILFILVSVPILLAFPGWMTGVVSLSVGCKLLSIRLRFHLSRWLIVLILILAVTLLIMNFMALGKEYGAVALLLILASLKLLEARGQRDAFLLMLIYFLLIMGGLMANQSPLNFFYLFLCLLYNLLIQIKLSQPDNLAISLRRQLISMGKIALVALPFVVVLFFFFPRIEPLWKQPSPPRAQTGLSDEMRPDGLAELALSGNLAFRVTFNGKRIPDSRYLYWRGPVLVDFDGKTWRRLQQTSKRQQLAAEMHVDEASRVSYTIYQTGAADKWVLPLDMPQRVPKNAQIQRGYEVQAAETIVKPTAFELTSYVQYQLLGLAAEERQQLIFLPQDIYPKARQLAATLRQSSSSDEDFVRHLLRYFNENPYYYDLAPAAGNDDIDTFLFDNKVGYCEHYASAFAFMLRSVNIPARVITGYQGGEINQISQELEVKQLNAHAWVEVYLPEKGWVRYDPTSAVAPNRVNNGSPIGSARNADLIDFTSRLETRSESYRWVSESVRALSSFWQNWVINYNRDKQASLWKRLGLAAMSSVAWILLVLALVPVVLIIIFCYRHYRQRQSGDVIWQVMQPFMRYLGKQGLHYTPSVPPLTFIRSASSRQLLAESQKDAEQVIKLYYQMRYGSDSVALTDLKAAIKACKNSGKT